jgi:hypothetical protein
VFHHEAGVTQTFDQTLGDIGVVLDQQNTNDRILPRARD